jgi:hypothetical protein
VSGLGKNRAPLDVLLGDETVNRRTFLQASAAVALPRFAIAETAGTRTLRFVPQANLTLLDPILTTAQPTVNHGWAVYDLLFGIDPAANQAADGRGLGTS